jgi:23S rRNA pseudouridine1911/1915/1917 synthase
MKDYMKRSARAGAGLPGSGAGDRAPGQARAAVADEVDGLDKGVALDEGGDEDGGEDSPAGGDAGLPGAAGGEAAHGGEQRQARVEVTEHGQRLDGWLVALAPEFSRSHLQQLIADGLVRCDGLVQTKPSRKVSVGQVIEVLLRPTAQSTAFRAEPLPLSIVFEDEHLLVVDKPAGLVVHPAAGHWSGTLLNGLLAHHAGAALLPRAGIVHRLDKDTSGLMVVAKTLVAQTALVRAIAAHEVRREYLALAHGRHASGLEVIDRPVGRDPVSRVRMAVHPAGKPARTDAHCLASVELPAGSLATGGGGASAGAWVSAWCCRLHTGRTHQIRVHLAAIGHPLVADALYGGRPQLGLARQALHAARLSFEHPVLGGWRVFSAALPPDLATAWQQLGPAVLRAAATMLEKRDT